LKWLTLFNLASASLGLACMLAMLVTGRENFGISLGHLAIGMQTLGGQIPPSIRSLSVEPNLFAIGTATVLCLSLGKYLLGDRSENKLIWMGLPALAILFAYTRSVYGALVIVLAVLMVYAGQARVIYRVVLAAAVAASLFIAVFLALPEENPTRKAIAERVATLIDFKGGTGGGRWAGYQVAWTSYLKHPILGNGTLTAETTVYNPYTGAFQERMGAPGWLTGSGLQALHDTGLIGLLIFLGMFGILVRKTHRAFRQLEAGDPSRGVLLGFLGGNLLIFISSQLSSPMWTAFPYVFWAVHMEYLATCVPGADKEPSSV
jgi:O-antigen ligase